jgi:parallel beta-helix repeat protein
MQKTSAGFWSYVHADDEYERGRIVRLRERLRQSVQFHTGVPFEVFLDKKDIGWGQQWEDRIKNSLNDALLLFPIITPRYFASKPCREEFLAFRERQEKLGRDDLILPIYYLTTDILEGRRGNIDADQSEVVQYLLGHQYEDFRSLRATEETDPSYSQSIERLGQRVTEALKRSRSGSDGKGGKEDKDSKAANESNAEEANESASSMAEGRENSTPGHITSFSVNQMPGRAHFTTIVDAIARAPGGARIVVHPGHYREQVVIDKPLELIGSGNVEDIVIESSEGEPLTFDTNIGLVRNLTIRQTKPYEKSTKSRECGVWIKQGRLELEDCDISSTDGACIFISNGADPRIRRNRVHNSGQSGILLKTRVRGTYEDNEVFGNSFSGMSVSLGACPTVRRNRFYGNKGSGILVKAGAEGTFEDNESFENYFAGVAVEDANPIVRRNRIYGNYQSGIRVVGGDGTGTYEDNEIFGNRRAGFKVETGSKPVVRRNRINKNGYEGIWIVTGAGGSFSDNDLTQNVRGAWDADEATLMSVSRERNIEDEE